MIVKIYLIQIAASSYIYPLSLHDALPISDKLAAMSAEGLQACIEKMRDAGVADVAIETFAELYERLAAGERSEEHTSELQSRRDLVCRLLLEKKNTYR